MLPESAWTLKHGEQIYGITPEGHRVDGIVHSIDYRGCSREEYIQLGFPILEAIKRQHDGPTILMFVGNQVIPWRPDYVERVTGEYTVMCATCGVVIQVQLPLRTFQKMSAGEPPSCVFENINPIFAAMILQSRCGEHACIP